MTNFMKGFNEIVPQRCIQLFDPKEVEVFYKNFKFKKKIKLLLLLLK